MSLGTKVFLWQFLFLWSIFSLSATIADAQIAGGLTETTNANMGGNNFIVGTVFWPSGEPINRKINIRLRSPTKGDILSTTDDRGRFIFSGVGAGLYVVVIDGEERFQPINEPVEVVRQRSAVPETYTLSIRLRDALIERSEKERPAVISVANAGAPASAVEKYRDAAKLVSAGQIKRAIDKLKLAVKEYPDFVNAYNELGVLYMRQNDLSKASAALATALKIDPQAYEPLINRGILLFRQSQFRDSITVLRDVLRINTRSATAYYYLGRGLLNLKQTDYAEAAFLSCIELDPKSFKEAYRFLAFIDLERGNAEKVIEHLEEYLVLSPNAKDAKNLKRVISKLKDQLPQKPHRPEHKLT